MSYVGLFKSQTHRPNESLVLWRLSCEILTHEANFVNSSLPAFFLSLTRTDNLKHLSLSHGFNFLNRHCPLSCFLLSFLFNHVGENFRISLLLSIHQISWHCSFLNILSFAFRVLLLMFFDRFLHLYLFFEPLLIEQFGFDSLKRLSFLGDDLGLPSILLPSLLLGI